jgi:pimeloyl-ACP methyl ester carboxylesterase
MHRWAGRKDLSVADISAEFGNEPLKTFSDGRILKISDVRDGVSLRFTARCLHDLDPAVMEAILEGQWPKNYDIEACLRDIQCPLLILRGDVAKGGMLPDTDAVHLMKQVKDGICVDFPTAGHLLHWQVRAEASMQVSAFLESLS